MTDCLKRQIKALLDDPLAGAELIALLNPPAPTSGYIIGRVARHLGSAATTAFCVGLVAGFRAAGYEGKPPIVVCETECAP